MPRPSALSLTTLVAVLCFVAGCSHLPASGPGRETVHDVNNYSVQTLDRLIVRLVREELAHLQ